MLWTKQIQKSRLITCSRSAVPGVVEDVNIVIDGLSGTFFTAYHKNKQMWMKQLS